MMRRSPLVASRRNALCRMLSICISDHKIALGVSTVKLHATVNLVRALLCDRPDPRDDRGPAQLLEDLDPDEPVALPHDFAGRDVESLDEGRHISPERRQLVALQLHSVSRNIAQRGVPEMLAALDLHGSADLDPWHGTPLAILAHQFAIEQRNDVDGIVEPDADLAATGPGNFASWTLARRQLNRGAVAKCRGQIDPESRAKRGDPTDHAVTARAP